MRRTFMHSKIHRASVTDSNLDYVGSVTISPELLAAARIGVHELVHIVNVNNGARFETYTILGAPGENQMIINGAAARLVQPKDKIIVISYAELEPHEIDRFESTVVHVDDQNQILEVASLPQFVLESL